MANDNWKSKRAKTIKSSEISSQKGKVNLNPKDFDLLVKQQGVRVKVYRTTFCPNVKDISGEHEIDCKLCHGSGFVDRSPKEAIAFISAQGLEKIHEVSGFWDGTSVSGTFEQGISLQYFTLVELCDFQESFIERIKRQEGSLDRLKYSTSCVNLLIDSTGIEYYQGRDFDLSEYGDISWRPSKAPAVNTIYSIHYEAAIQFRAIQAIHVARFGQIQDGAVTKMVKLNESWQLQKEYLVERTDKLGKPLTKNQIRDSGEE